MNEKNIINTLEAFYKRTNIYNIKVEFGSFGKWDKQDIKVRYSKNNVDYYSDYYKYSDIEKIENSLKRA